MTPTATYIAEENCLQEISNYGRPPDKPDIRFYSSSQEDMYHRHTELWESVMQAYNANKAKYEQTLRKIPCSPEPGFKGGEKYTEGVDYEIKGAGDWKWCYQIKGNIFAAPLVPVKSEDELWREVCMRIFEKHISKRDDMWIDTSAAISYLKKHYSISINR